MKKIAEGCNWSDEKKCPVCGRSFTVLHPSRWAYKKPRGVHYTYFCSWKCLRAQESGKERKEKPEMVKEKNARIRRDKRELLEGLIEAFEGECYPPVDYLKEQGYKNPEEQWHEMKTWSRVNAPDLYQKLVEHKLVKPKPDRQKRPIVEVAKKLPEKVNGYGVELVYDPSIAEEYRREQQIEESLKYAATKDQSRDEWIDGIEPLQPASLWSRVLEDGTFTKVNGIGMMLRGMNYQLILSPLKWFKLTEEILVALRQLKADAPAGKNDEN